MKKRSILSTFSEVLGLENLRSEDFAWTNITLWVTFNTLLTSYDIPSPMTEPWDCVVYLPTMDFVDFYGKM